MSKCGCRIVVIPESGSMLGGPLAQKLVQDIEYCPLHAAAEMVTLHARFALAILDRIANGEPEWERVTRQFLREALAASKGE